MLILPEAVLSTAYAVARIAVIAILALAGNRLGNRLIDRYVKMRDRVEEPITPELVAVRKRAYTAAALMRDILKYVIFAIALYSIVIVLSIDFPQLMTLLAGLGVAGVAVAFGAQSILRDVTAGFFIIFENQYSVGDVVRIRLTGFDVFGIVEEFSLRFTKVRDLSGNLRFVPNGGILGVDRYSSGYATYRFEFLLPQVDRSGAERAVVRVSELYADHPLLLGPLTIERITEGESGLLVAVVAKAFPSDEQVVKGILEAISFEMTRTLSLGEPPISSFYEASDEAISIYERSVFVGQT